MTLYDIDKAIREFEFEIDEETGEILNTDALDKLHMAREQKIENIGLYIKEIKAESDAIKHEIENLTARMKQNNNKAESLLDYMKYALNGENFKTPRMVASFRKSKSVNIIDERLIPDKFVDVSVQRTPDKKLIRKAIESGEEVNGAQLVVNNNLTVK